MVRYDIWYSELKSKFVIEVLDDVQCDFEYEYNSLVLFTVLKNILIDEEFKYDWELIISKD